jgi:hypothetical protein
MDEQTFWDLADRLDQVGPHDAADLREFADHLTRAVHGLDTPAHFRAAPQDFLGVRCAVVAAGPTAYRKVLHSPAATADFAVGPRSLVAIVESHGPPAGYATGSNREAWGTHWLSPQLGFSPHLGSAAPQAYMIALRHVAIGLDADPAWKRWWEHSGVAECELGIVAEGGLGHPRPSADIQMVGEQVRANFTCAVPATDRRAAELVASAVTEVTGMFAVIREAIGLPALPRMPALVELPPETHEIEVTTRPMPAEQPEQGYLTLTQIHEFFG